jgi:hypothetical protein
VALGSEDLGKSLGKLAIIIDYEHARQEAVRRCGRVTCR